jgi:hypothetical protein
MDEASLVVCGMIGDKGMKERLKKWCLDVVMGLE